MLWSIIRMYKGIMSRIGYMSGEGIMNWGLKVEICKWKIECSQQVNELTRNLELFKANLINTRIISQCDFYG